MTYDMGYDDRHTDRCGSGCLYYIGVAGVGMSPLAQYCAGKGIRTVGSDRSFAKGETQDMRELGAKGVECVPQDGKHLPEDIRAVVASAAVEDTNPDIREAKARGISMMQRSDLLAEIVKWQEGGSVCVAGTAGKSTTTLLVYTLLREAYRRGEVAHSPQLIAGAAHNDAKRKGESGNVDYEGDGALVFEGDESDKSVVKYHPSISIVTNIGHDHHEMDVTLGLFQQLADQTSGYVVLNVGDALVRTIKAKKTVTFAMEGEKADFVVTNLKQTSEGLTFKINGTDFAYRCIGLHNAQNVAAAVAVAVTEGANIETCAEVISAYGGAYRRGNIIGKSKKGAVVVDDFAHTPEEMAETIRTMASFSKRVFAIYQPHGYGPLRKTYEEMIPLLKSVLRPNDKLVLTKVYYEGGTTDMTIDAEFVSKYFNVCGIGCVYAEDREAIVDEIIGEAEEGDSIVVMGARDKSLAEYAERYLK